MCPVCGIAGLYSPAGAPNPELVDAMRSALVHRGPDGTLAFASELKALLRLPQVSREIDLDAVDAYLALQYVPGDKTALRGIHKLAPGHVLVTEGGTERTERYWQPEPAEPSMDEDE